MGDKQVRDSEYFKRLRDGYYTQYHDRQVVILTPDGGIVIMPCLMSIIGWNTTHFSLLRNDFDKIFALKPTTKQQNEHNSYSIVYGGSGNERQARTCRVNVHNYAKVSGAWLRGKCVVLGAEISNGMIVVDLKQTPEIIDFHRRTEGDYSRPDQSV